MNYNVRVLAFIVMFAFVSMQISVQGNFISQRQQIAVQLMQTAFFKKSQLKKIRNLEQSQKTIPNQVLSSIKLNTMSRMTDSSYVQQQINKSKSLKDYRLAQFDCSINNIRTLFKCRVTNQINQQFSRLQASINLKLNSQHIFQNHILLNSTTLLLHNVLFISIYLLLQCQSQRPVFFLKNLNSRHIFDFIFLT
ncbi:hypothetical protein ABPG72_009208 [Tetrahymena utriculariae]